MPSDLEDAAVDYVNAFLGCKEADNANLSAALVHCDDMLHTLIWAAGYPCPMCDPPSCPLAGKEPRQ